MRCGPGLGCASLGRLCRVRCFFISGFPVSRLGVTRIRSRCCCRRIRSFRVLRIRRDHILNDRQAFADVRRNVAVASHPRCLLQASVRSQFPMSPVGLKCPRIRVNGLGRPNHRASRVLDGNRSDPDNHPMACLVPQGYLGSRRPFIAQHARPRAPDLANPFFRLFLLRREEIPARMSHHGLPQVPGNLFRPLIPEPGSLVAVDHIKSRLHAFRHDPMDFRVCEDGYGTTP